MITPIELKNKQFTVRLRGYDRPEVDAFLAIMLKDYESLYRHFRKTSEEDAGDVTGNGQEAASSGPEPARMPSVQEAAPRRSPGEADLGDSLKAILAMAQKAAEEARKAASDEASAIIQTARLEAQRAASDAGERVKAAEQRLADLQAQEAAIRARMKGFLEMYRQLIEDFESTSGIDYGR